MNLAKVFTKISLKKTGFLLGLVLILGLGLFLPTTASANFGSWLGQNLILPLAEFIGGLTVTLIGILIGIVQYNDFINAPAVAKGWVIIRDLANMFVIVVMLVIAFATVFRIEEYQYKKLLSKLLIMSVLVNFSKMLTGFFIDFAQVVMLTFVNGFKEAAAGNLVNGFHLSEMFEFSKSKTIEGATPNENSFFVASILALISITVAMVVVAIYLVVFLVRIAFLWLLTIMSPLAFLLAAFPGQAKKYSSEWWEYFGKYLSAGPILAFFLWLALSMMQTSNNVLDSFVGQSGSDYSFKDVPGVAITGIGQSEILLSFIINIVILLGGLWMTQKLGVAGGKLAGSALAKMQSIGSSIVKSPFTVAKGVAGLAGKGAKELGSYLWSEASARLGVQGSIEKWKHGWEAGKHKREESRDTIRQSVYSKRREKGSFWQVLGSPEHLFEHQWNWRTLGKVATGHMDEVTGKKAAEHYQQQQEKLEQAKALEEQLKMRDKGGSYRGELLGGQKLFEEELKVFDDDYKMIEDGRNIKQAHVHLESLKKEMANFQGQGKVSQAMEKQEEADELSKLIDIMSTDSGKEKLLQNNRLKFSQARKKLDDINKKLLLPNSELADLKNNELKDDIDKLLIEADNLGPDKLTKQQRHSRKKEIDKLEEQKKDVIKDRENRRTQEKVKGRTPQEINELLKKDNDLLRRIDEDLKNLRRNDQLTKKEKDENIKQASILRKEAEKLQENFKSSAVGAGELDELNRQIKQLKDEAGVLGKSAEKFSPSTDYGIRRDQRLAINKEKGDMTTDNWEELFKIFEDAVHVGDSNRAAAAALKATEYGNENEFFNMYGYDSDAGGLKQFVEDIFIKKLGMAREQALSVASDIAYTGEGVQHWGVARAVNVKNGRLEWADEDERMIECLAEVRKQDFENFSRRANRLAYGREVIEYGNLPADASREEKAKYYREHRNRKFELNDFGKAYILENYSKYPDMMGRGRFNVNLATKVGSNNNLENLDNLAQKTGIIARSQYGQFKSIMGRVRNYGTGMHDEFDDIKKILKIK
ncbi:hypothetical protein KKC17_02290 [Patescibacteria group bacterium]|nr:hypothetical protein [Patescibacteria group bacterium]